MNDATRKKIERVARKARKWMEHLVEREQLCDKETLDGMCARASAKLFVLLKPHYRCRLVLARQGPHDCHVFIMYDNYIIDITATQFDSDAYPVEIFHKGLVEEDEWWWQNLTHFSSAKELYNNQKKTKWPEDQTIRLEDLRTKERHKCPCTK